MSIFKDASEIEILNGKVVHSGARSAGGDVLLTISVEGKGTTQQWSPHPIPVGSDIELEIIEPASAYPTVIIHAH
tara:strand:+ start:754 stop:978 length:225 start_codon:yes stop_codon:yes gene_type:complete